MDEISAPGYIPNAPDLVESGEDYVNKRRAIADDSQIHDIVNRVDKDSEELILNAAKIQRKIDGIDPPFNPADLEEQGMAWKYNIPTGFLQTVAGKVAPRLSSYLDNARYLINVNLPLRNDETGAPIENAFQKSQKFQEVFTETLRGWLRFNAFQVGLAHETGIYGFCFPAFLDEDDWKPTLYRLDRAFIPSGTEIMDLELPWLVVKAEYKVHELFEKIADKEFAELAGWDIEAAVEAINDAMPVDQPSDGGVETESRMYEDLKRECVPGFSYRKNVQTIKCRHLFVKEYDGRVSQYIWAENTKEVIFRSEDRYESMADVVVPFTFQYGNGTVHGSYGIGQMLYDLALGIERARNNAFDQLETRGKLILQSASANDLAKVKMQIFDTMAVVAGGTIAGNAAALGNNSAAFIEMDRYFSGLAEQKVGAFLPPPIVPGANVTATQAAISGQREDEMRAAILAYWVRNWAVLSHAIARRMFNPNTSDIQALRAQQECLKYMSQEEMLILANTSPTATILDFTDAKRNQVVAYCASKIGNPLYNQHRLEHIMTSSAIGEDMADDLIIPQEDQTILAEATRQQILEITALEQGIQVPISPRDNDPVHMAVLRGEPDESGQFTQGPIVALLGQGNQQGAQAAFMHYVSHYQQAEAKKVLGEQINVERQFISQMQQMFQQQQQAQQAQQIPQGAMMGAPIQ
jgi:hypothetical protein